MKTRKYEKRYYNFLQEHLSKGLNFLFTMLLNIERNSLFVPWVVNHFKAYMDADLARSRSYIFLKRAEPEVIKDSLKFYPCPTIVDLIMTLPE